MTFGAGNRYFGGAGVSVGGGVAVGVVGTDPIGTTYQRTSSTTAIAATIMSVLFVSIGVPQCLLLPMNRRTRCKGQAIDRLLPLVHRSRRRPTHQNRNRPHPPHLAREIMQSCEGPSTVLRA
jgi:hypothetical protein